MRLFTAMPAVLFLLIGLQLGCSDSPTERSSMERSRPSTVIPQKDESPAPLVETLPTFLTIGPGDLKLMVDFIQKKGFKIPDPLKRGDDKQYTFVDSTGNRHAMIPVQLKEGQYQISVWAYRKGIRDQEHFFGYDINETGATSYIPADFIKPGEAEDVRLGVTEFLEKVKKGT